MDSQRPNILFILTDQHSKSSIGAYGSTYCKTPNIDRLADEGVVFDNAYTVCPVCSPARASLQTGLYPFKHGMQTNIFMHGCMVHELADRPFLLSRKLESAAYNSGYTGKWHLGYGRDAFNDAYYNSHIREIDAFRDYIEYPREYRQASGMPSSIGYIGDDFPGHGGGGQNYPQYQDYLRQNNIVEETEKQGDFGHIVSSGEEGTVDYFLVERSKSIISELEGKGKPWFHMLNFWGPHEPYYPPRSYFDLYRDIDIPQWKSFSEDLRDKPRIHWAKRRHDLSWEHFQEELRLYYAYVTFIDAQIGRLFSWLKEKGIWENTIIIFSADHGDSMGIHGGLCDKSYHLYEETAAIPLLIRAPGMCRNKRETGFANTTDIYATILDIAGASLPDISHGRSLLPLMKGEENCSWVNEVLAESSGIGPSLHSSRMLRIGKYKYIFNCGSIDELYNLEEDPDEMRNLSAEESSASLISGMRNRMLEILKDKGDPLAEQFPRFIFSY